MYAITWKHLGGFGEGGGGDRKGNKSRLRELGSSRRKFRETFRLRWKISEISGMRENLASLVGLGP